MRISKRQDPLSFIQQNFSNNLKLLKNLTLDFFEILFLIAFFFDLKKKKLIPT
jgi:hypothetical protein